MEEEFPSNLTDPQAESPVKSNKTASFEYYNNSFRGFDSKQFPILQQISNLTGDDFDGLSVDSSFSTTTSSTTLGSHNFQSSLFIAEKSDFYDPQELVFEELPFVAHHVQEYWLRIGTLLRQLLLIKKKVKTQKKRTKVYQVQSVV